MYFIFIYIHFLSIQIWSEGLIPRYVEMNDEIRKSSKLILRANWIVCAIRDHFYNQPLNFISSIFDCYRIDNGNQSIGM